MTKIVRLSIIAFFIHFNVFSQETSLVSKVGELENSIELKWYNEKLSSALGVDIYRKEEAGEWIKITSSKVRRGNTSYLNLLQSDTNSYELALDLKSNWNPKGIMLLNILVKSFENNNLAKYLGIYYEDLSVKKGNNYIYKIVDNNDKVLVISDTINISKKEFEAPKEFKLDKEKKEIHINWLPEETRYFAINIFRKDSISEYTQINKHPIMPSKTGKGEYPKFFYLDNKVKEGVKYTYALKALDFFGAESEKTQELQIMIPDKTPPIPPFNLRKVDVKKQEVILAWDNPTYKDAIGLNVYRSQYFKGPFDKINLDALTRTDTTYTDIAPESKDYYYYIASVDQSGNEAFSTKIIINVEDMTPPITPTGLIALSDTGKIELKWNKNNEKDLKGYLLYRTIINADSSRYTLLNSTPIADTFFIDKRPKRAQNKFAYSIVSIDSAFNTSYYSKPVLLKMPDVISPETPLIKNAISKDGKVTIEWVKNVDLDLKNYLLYRKLEKEKNYTKIGSTKNSFLQDSTLKSNVVYLYTLKAQDSIGNLSPFSNSFKVKSSKVLLYNQSLIVNYKIKKKGKLMKLNWKKNNIKENCKGYVVFYNDQNNSRLKTKLIKEKKITLQNYSGSTVIVKAYMVNGEIITSEKINTLAN